jgi:hypothetical protein
MIFLVSSSGFLMYKSNCACTGNEQVTVFVKSEICTSDMVMDSSEEAEMSCCSTNTAVEVENPAESSCCSSKEKGVENLRCQEHESDYDCDKTEVTYLKLQNKVLKEEVKFIKVEPVVLMVLHTLLSSDVLLDGNTPELENPYIDPPPIKGTSLDFLIQIQQLKIPALA